MLDRAWRCNDAATLGVIAEKVGVTVAGPSQQLARVGLIAADYRVISAARRGDLARGSLHAASVDLVAACSQLDAARRALIAAAAALRATGPCLHSAMVVYMVRGPTAIARKGPTMAFLRSRPDLLASFRAGAQAAVDAVYRAYLKLLDSLARNGFEIKEPDKRMDLIHDTFVRAFKPEARLAYDGQRDYWPYLAVIARNVFITSRRRDQRERVLPNRASSPDGDPLAKLLETEAVVDPEAEHGWLEPRALEIARAYIASLTDPLRAVHAARYVECLSTRDAAEHLGLSHKKLRTLEDRLRSELLERLTRAGIRASHVPSVPPTEMSRHG